METVIVIPDENERAKRARSMRRLRETGATFTEIAKMYGISRQRVQKLLSRPLDTAPTQ
jgi:DNA-directed RNA polymerase sigma subunit (sigma70/sigma32)